MICLQKMESYLGKHIAKVKPLNQHFSPKKPLKSPFNQALSIALKKILKDACVSLEVKVFFVSKSQFLFQTIAKVPGAAQVNLQPTEHLLCGKQFSKNVIFRFYGFRLPRPRWGGVGVKPAPKPSFGQVGIWVQQTTDKKHIKVKKNITIIMIIIIVMCRTDSFDVDQRLRPP